MRINETAGFDGLDQSLFMGQIVPSGPGNHALADAIMSFWGNQYREHGIFMNLLSSRPELKRAASMIEKDWTRFLAATHDYPTFHRLVGIAVQEQTHWDSLQRAGTYIGPIPNSFVLHLMKEEHWGDSQTERALANQPIITCDDVTLAVTLAAEHAGFIASLTDISEEATVKAVLGTQDRLKAAAPNCLAMVLPAIEEAVAAIQAENATIASSGAGLNQVKFNINKTLADHVGREQRVFEQTAQKMASALKVGQNTAS